jgi:hypothetical protein
MERRAGFLVSKFAGMVIAKAQQAALGQCSKMLQILLACSQKVDEKGK